MAEQKNEIAKTSKGLMPISIEEVEGKIVEIRGQKVLLDRDCNARLANFRDRVNVGTQLLHW